MYKIQTNLSGTRSITVEESHLETLHRYKLLDNLVDSNGIVDEGVLDKLKFNIRSLLSSDAGKDKELLNLCLDVVYHNNMKALGLSNLIKVYDEWTTSHSSDETVADTTPEE